MCPRKGPPCSAFSLEVRVESDWGGDGKGDLSSLEGLGALLAVFPSMRGVVLLNVT